MISKEKDQVKKNWKLTFWKGRIVCQVPKTKYGKNFYEKIRKNAEIIGKNLVRKCLF